MNGERFIFPGFRRDPITNEIISKYMTEETIIHPYSPIVIASQIIDEFYRMKVVDRSGFYILDDYLIEVFNKEDIEDVGRFYCDYTNKTVYFHPSIVTKSIRLEYYGCGDIKISSNSIVTQTDMADDVVQTLDDILNSGNAGNLNESWGRVTYIQPSSNILQLTKNRRQYVTNGTLLTGTTIKLPTMELGDYLQLTLMFYADSDLVLVFEDENIKWSNQPLIQAGRSYSFSFEYVEGTWYCEWVKLERYLKAYIYKAGDTCSALTGGYSYSAGTNANNRLSINATSTDRYYPEYATATTISKIDMTNYAKLYLDFDCPSYSSIITVRIGSTVVYNINTTTRKIVAIDVSSITGLNNITFQATGYRGSYSTLNIYNAWLEKNEFVDTSQEIFTTSDKNKLTSISASANKVIDSTINGNILIDNVETNVYYIQSGTTAQRPTPTLIGQAYFDTTLGKQINAKTLSPVVWVDGIGTVC